MIDETLSIKKIKAIDIHCHCGQYNGINKDSNEFMSGDIEYILELQERACAGCSIMSHFKAIEIDSNCDPLVGNEMLFRIARNYRNVYQWVVVNPDVPGTFDQAGRMLESGKCAGIKIHPEMHHYNIKDKGEKIFEFAALHRTIVLSHTGQQRSMPEDFVDFADAYPDMKLILAHLGYGWDGNPFHQAYAILKNKSGNIYTDTSSANLIIPNILEKAVEMIGAEKILYGSDAPCYFSPMHRARIDHAFISHEDKYKILVDNARKIFCNILM